MRCSPTGTAGIYVDPAAIHEIELPRPAVRRAGCRDAARRPAGAAGAAAGRRLRRRARVRRAARRCVVHPALRRWKRAALLRRRQGPRGRRRAETPTSSRCSRPPPSCSATPPRKPPSGPATSALQQVSGPTAIAMLEQVWQRDLSDYDPDGPLPDVEPADDPTLTQGRVRHGDPKAIAASWRERAEAEKLSIRELVIAVTNRQQFVGTPAAGGRRDRSARAVRRVRRVHPGAAPDAARPRRVRRPRGASPAGARGVPAPSTAATRCASTWGCPPPDRLYDTRTRGGGRGCLRRPWDG